jgi:hypothetical protein
VVDDDVPFSRRSVNFWAGANWTLVASGTTADLFGIAELDYTNLYVVGAAGTILKSSDAGLTWSAKPSGTTATLRAVSISKASSDHVIAAGLGGTVLRSTDAGESWCLLDAGTTNDLFGAEAVNDTEYLVGGAQGLLLRTTNGGGPCGAPSTVPAPWGIPQAIDAEQLRLEGPVPQPSTGGATISVLAGAGEHIRVRVFDSAGRLVGNPPEVAGSAGDKTTLVLDTHNWAGGVYLLQVTSGGRRATRHLVVMR